MGEAECLGFFLLACFLLVQYPQKENPGELRYVLQRASAIGTAEHVAYLPYRLVEGLRPGKSVGIRDSSLILLLFGHGLSGLAEGGGEQSLRQEFDFGEAWLETFSERFGRIEPFSHYPCDPPLLGYLWCTDVERFDRRHVDCLVHGAAAELAQIALRSHEGIHQELRVAL